MQSLDFSKKKKKKAKKQNTSYIHLFQTCKTAEHKRSLNLENVFGIIRTNGVLYTQVFQTKMT